MTHSRSETSKEISDLLGAERKAGWARDKGTAGDMWLDIRRSVLSNPELSLVLLLWQVKPGGIRDTCSDLSERLK